MRIRMRRRNVFMAPAVKALIALLLLSNAPVGVSAGGIGTSGATFLLIRPMARPAGMGNAYTGLAEGIEALAFNPAGITSVDKWDVGLSQILYPLDMYYSYGAVARRINPKGVAAVHLTYLGGEDVSRNSLGQSTGTFSNYDVGFGLSYGHQLAPEIAVGGTLRYIQSKLATYNASAIGADIGVKYSPLGWKGLTIGAALQNIGTGLNFISSSSPQPLAARVGVAWQPAYEKYTLTGDLSFDREAQGRVNVGAEYRVIPSFALRTGFDVANDANLTRALKFGAGFLSRVGSFDYAFESFGPTGNNHRFSYSYLGGQSRDTVVKAGGFFQGIQPRGRVNLGLMNFVNLSPSTEFDWLAEGFREIFAARLARAPGIVLTDRRNVANYVIEGRYSTLGSESVWIGVKIVNPVDGSVVAFREATVLQDDLIGGATTLAGAVSALVPSR